MAIIVDPRRHDAVVFELDALADIESAGAALVRDLQHAGVGTAAISPAAADGSGLFTVCVDGPAGPPDPAVLVDAATRLDVRPGRCAVIVGTAAGATAARSAGFALVIGVGGDLCGPGADTEVTDLRQVTVRAGDRRMSALVDALSALDDPDDPIVDRHPAVFSDYDGTLSEIVDDPDSARLTDGAGAALTRLAGRCPVAVLSGRDLTDICTRVGVSGIWYAGSHGFELTGPDGTHHENDAAASAIPLLADAAEALRSQLGVFDGVVVEHKRFGVAVHYRNARREQVGPVTGTVRAAGRHYTLRVTTGREVIELRPDVDWDKGRTLRWIIDHVTGGDAGPLLPIYLGDDITDEDAFDAIGDDGIAIVVRHTDDGDRATAARFALEDPARVTEFTRRLADRLSRFDTIGYQG